MGGDDFNKADANVPQYVKKYHTVVWEILNDSQRDQRLTDYINDAANKGFILDSITNLGASGHFVLLVFVEN